MDFSWEMVSGGKEVKKQKGGFRGWERPLVKAGMK